LRKAVGYLGTEVKCESVDDGTSENGRYRVKDFWTWHRGFEIFRERLSEDFAAFDQQVVNELIEKEQFVGAYYEKPDDGSEQDLVLS
jgi:hypothetical protein